MGPQPSYQAQQPLVLRVSVWNFGFMVLGWEFRV